jgi:hypothetical protein
VAVRIRVPSPAARTMTAAGPADGTRPEVTRLGSFVSRKADGAAVSSGRDLRCLGWEKVHPEVTLHQVAALARRHSPDMGRIPAGYLPSARLGGRSHLLRHLPPIVPQARDHQALEARILSPSHRAGTRSLAAMPQRGRRLCHRPGVRGPARLGGELSRVV